MQIHLLICVLLVLKIFQSILKKLEKKMCTELIDRSFAGSVSKGKREHMIQNIS